jgi:hypothetical protein
MCLLLVNFSGPVIISACIPLISLNLTGTFCCKRSLRSWSLSWETVCPKRRSKADYDGEQYIYREQLRESEFVIKPFSSEISRAHNSTLSNLLHANR